jgi:hypothetical protein
MSEDTAKGLATIIDMFYGERLVIKILPYEDADVRIVGPLRPEYLRDSLDDIRYKYGSAPTGKWKLFGQISSIPNVNSPIDSRQQYSSNNIEGAMGAMFEKLRVIERLFGVSFPEIAVTPIALYRE